MSDKAKEIIGTLVMLGGFVWGAIGLSFKFLSWQSASPVIGFGILIYVLLLWGDKITELVVGKEGFRLKKRTESVFQETKDISPDELPEELKDKARLTAIDILKHESAGNPLTAEMHFVLGLDAANKGDMEEAARRLGIAALSEKHLGAYNNWGNALSELAKTKKDEALFRESFGKYAEAVRIKPDAPETYYNWGNALYGLAEMKGDEALFRESMEKYTEAVRIKPAYHEAYNNWGLALSELAGMKRDEALFLESCDKNAEAVRIKPDKHEAYTNWGNALSKLAGMKGDETLFRKAFTKYEKAVSIQSNHGYYTNWTLALRACAKIVKDEDEREALLKQAEDKEKIAEEIRRRETP